MISEQQIMCQSNPALWIKSRWQPASVWLPQLLERSSDYLNLLLDMLLSRLDEKWSFDSSALWNSAPISSSPSPSKANLLEQYSKKSYHHKKLL